ncbi:putative cytochrome c oxidase subunit 5b-like [Hordeum vulgare]|uniref:putative cytochrome c oxidase subunit 5b-like n=1 Tax=Hordeum vulgare subsp. vulgare TaxID=112509 RepID=UPI00162BDB6D|nr:putative cytochrome c oxidase subunit 5b-like [Hordeum vulgare subsp. vulgare]KAE8785040.1 putative cytochrome c oxidase subunit 5b-like [Hordeum vulgare]
MWKRAASLLLARRSAVAAQRAPAISGSAASALRRAPAFFSTLDAGQARTRVEDVMPIATGLEREEIEAELQGKKRFDMDAPVGPFGTKENPAIIQSYFDKRIVGCPGDEGEDEHDVVWFWLEKGKPHECPVCTQYFKLEVIGNGGNPDGHDDEDDHHHH